MLTETTVSKLREMRLSVIANALKDQLADPQFQSMAFEDWLGLLVDAEWNARKNNHLNKLIRQATFSDPGACLENVEYLPDRGLKQGELLRFGTCNYIQEHHNIILLGATGSGKTYLACALGMAAVRRFYAVKYIRLPDLLVEFQIARGNGTIRKLITVPLGNEDSPVFVTPSSVSLRTLSVIIYDSSVISAGVIHFYLHPNILKLQFLECYQIQFYRYLLVV